MTIDRLCILGVGLIGGSLALAARAAGACREVVGCGRDPAHLDRAVERGVIDRYELDPATAVAGADVVVVAVPVGALEGVLAAIAPALGPETVVTDVGSTKGSVVAAARAAFGEVPARFVPGHPIAGTERSGVEAAFAELFRDHRVILTPLPETDREAAATVRRLWEAAGAHVSEMEVAHHDQVLAETSHLPHVLAFALVDSLAKTPEQEEVFQYAAGGFRDFTRIASSDPVMWRDICISNREALLAALQRYTDDLAQLVDAIDRGDGERLLEVFQKAKSARDRFFG
ncbi:MAG TPA: prephenate dehydrogenase/arogenate dehydrogenase family protein [Gammaproteobacteria bacterium]|nr:prephenate dehydrogenase/arogenate dehydrogenase family protein [Gammaproteobacteria bacterium]